MNFTIEPVDPNEVVCIHTRTIKKYTLTVKVERDTYDSIQVLALDKGIGVSKYLRQIIEAHVESKTGVLDEELRLAFLKTIKDRKTEHKVEPH